MSSKKFTNFLPCMYRTPSQKSTLGTITPSKTNKSWIIADSTAFLTKNQIESCRKIINRVLKKKKLKYSIKLQYNLVKTKKSIGSRMGKGKGKVYDKVAFVKKHSVLFEFNNLSFGGLQQLVCKIRYKIPISISWKSSSFEKDIYI